MVWQMVKDGPFGGLWNQLKILRHEKMMPSTLISGANRGIGLEFARQYLADKWQIYASCRDPSSASELRRMVDGSRGKLQVLSMDVGDLASVKAAALELQGKPIDLILNNAGIGGPRGQTIGNIDYETWRHVLDTCVVMNPGWVQTDMGGQHARLTAPESVSAMRRLIDKLGPGQSGKFFNWDGREYAW
jgi:NAD(P)-dependent dehydrogenase (short-subunit alcohol dehydrogenase family)